MKILPSFKTLRPKKVLFLDADGVINNAKTLNIDGWPIDPFCAFLVGRIVDRTDCAVVLSSSWRVIIEGRETVANRVTPIFDVTDSGGSCRGEEIKDWLLDRNVERYAILDDDSDMLPEQQEHFFKTSWEVGLTEEIANKVIEHLNEN